jgi:hypothetical protein
MTSISLTVLQIKALDAIAHDEGPLEINQGAHERVYAATSTRLYVIWTSGHVEQYERADAEVPA